MPRPTRFRSGAVLVTGGAGFIGSHLVRRLAADGNAVRVLDNLATGRLENLAELEGVETVQGDIRSRADVRGAMTGVGVVFHVAALPSVARSWSDPIETLSTNAHGTANVVEAAIEAGVSSLIYSSSSSVYGDQEGDLKAETLEPRPISPYAYSKFLGEKIALANARDKGLRVVALRYFNVFGARQDPDSPYSAVIPLFIKQARAGGTATIHGDGMQSRDFTHVDNVVDANVRALESGVSGFVMNIACGKSYSLLQLVAAISALNGGHELKVSFGPARIGDIRHSQADISLATAKIGYRPAVTFEDGLRRTFDDYRTA